jgi:glycosyltransferase involved in cell wall biosynthesis
MREEITPLILTFNEAPNLERTLGQLTWAKRIVVLDSFSTDQTIDIARRFPQVEIVQRPFDTFADQCNFGLTHVQTPWVLSLDADYVLSDQLVAELKNLRANDSVAGLSARFQYWISGHPLRASLYPPRTVLYRKAAARYENDGHGHRVRIDGPAAELNGIIYHDDRKSLSPWFAAQQKYAAAEATKLVGTPLSDLSFRDRLRCKIIFAPWLIFFYTLLGKGLILDGWPGWFYVLQRTYAELLLSLHLLEKKLKR